MGVFLTGNRHVHHRAFARPEHGRRRHENHAGGLGRTVSQTCFHEHVGFEFQPGIGGFSAHRHRTSDGVDHRVDVADAGAEVPSGQGRRVEGHFVAGADPGQIPLIGVDQYPNMAEIGEFEQHGSGLDVIARRHPALQHDAAPPGQYIEMLAGHAALLDTVDLLIAELPEAQFFAHGPVKLREVVTGPRGLEQLPLGGEQFGRVHRGQALACPHGLAGETHLQPLDPSRKVGRDRAQPAFVHGHPAAEVQFGIRSAGLHGHGLYPGQRHRFGRHGVNGWISYGTRGAFGYRNQVHGAERTFPRFGLPDLRVHGAGPGAGFRRVFVPVRQFPIAAWLQQPADPEADREGDRCQKDFVFVHFHESKIYKPSTPASISNVATAR